MNSISPESVTSHAPPATEDRCAQPQQPSVLTEQMRREIAGAIAEIDPEQLRILQRLTPAQRVQQAASLIDAAEQVTAYRLRQRQPHLSNEEALQIVRRGLVKHILKQSAADEHK